MSLRAVAHKEVLDIKGYSNGGDADSVVENRAGLELPFLKSLLLKFLLLKFLVLNMSFLMSLTLYPLNVLNTAIIHGHFPRTKMAARFGGQSHFPQCFALFGMCSGGLALKQSATVPSPNSGDFYIPNFSQVVK